MKIFDAYISFEDGSDAEVNSILAEDWQHITTAILETPKEDWESVITSVLIVERP